VDLLTADLRSCQLESVMLTQLAQFGIELASQFVAAAVADQWVEGLSVRIWACSANLGYFPETTSRI
jgi:hypothetical protein